MKREKMAITGIVLVVVVVGLGVGASLFTYGGSSGITADRDLLNLGLQLPSYWEFELANGSTLTMSDWTGKTILVDLMATWCTYCSTQNGYLETIYETFSGSLDILSLTIDRSETAQMMSDDQSDRGLPWDHGLDTNSKFTSYFNVTGVPTLILIDSDGYFRYMHIGLWTDAVLTDIITSIMQ